MNNPETVTVSPLLKQAVEALRAVAREHKQASAYHRRRSRIAMRSLEELKNVCKLFKIELQIDDEEQGARSWSTKIPHKTVS